MHLSPSWALLYGGLWSRLALQALLGWLSNKHQPNGANQSSVGFYSGWNLWSHSWRKLVLVAFAWEREACWHLALPGLRQVSLMMEEGIAQDLLRHLLMPSLPPGWLQQWPSYTTPAVWASALGSCSFAKMAPMTCPKFTSSFHSLRVS